MLRRRYARFCFANFVFKYGDSFPNARERPATRARNGKRITEAANREGWPAQKPLATLLEIEVAERASRRIQRHRDQSETPVGKTFASFDFTAAPELSKPHLLALGAGG